MLPSNIYNSWLTQYWDCYRSVEGHCAEHVYTRNCSVCCIRCVALARVDARVLHLSASSPSHFEYRNINEPASKESEGSILLRQ